MERTLVILKPDAVRRKMAGEIITRFEKRNMTINAIKIMTISKETALEHYEHVKGEAIFDDMIEYLASGPSIIMILEGENIIKMVRDMIGNKKTYNSPPGTIRGDLGYHDYQNLIHASDSAESAEIEIIRFMA